MGKLKGFLGLLSVLFFGLSLAGCQAGVVSQTVVGNGVMTTQERPLVGIKRVALNTLGDLTIVVGERQKLVIEAEENLVEYLVSDVRSGTLYISLQEGIDFQPTKPVRYTLTVPALDGLAVNSLGNIRAPALEAERFEININSAGNVHLDSLSAEQLEVTISSSGDVQIDGGQVQDSFIRISSIGNYLAQGLTTQTARVQINSSGNATLRVVEDLKAVLSSTGNLYYYGDPIVDVRASSTGRALNVER